MEVMVNGIVVDVSEL